jgi:hypothetical protein
VAEPVSKPASFRQWITKDEQSQLPAVALKFHRSVWL